MCFLNSLLRIFVGFSSLNCVAQLRSRSTKKAARAVPILLFRKPLPVPRDDLGDALLHLALGSGIENEANRHLAILLLYELVPSILVRLLDLLACPRHTLAPLRSLEHGRLDNTATLGPYVFLGVQLGGASGVRHLDNANLFTVLFESS